MRRLQTRLFVWFLLAIVMAILASTATWWITHPNPAEVPSPGRIAMRNIAHNVSKYWDSPDDLAAYLQRVHDVVGIEVRLRRDVENLGHVHSAPLMGASYDGKGHGYVPIFREHEMVGAIEFDSYGPPPPHWWNLFAALGAAIFALAVAARAVARRLARPLETVVHAADRFGRGELATRTRLDEGIRAHWVAEEVRDVARAFDTMAERIEGVVRDQRELLGAISHELRSPLGRARIALEIARDRSDDASAPSFDEIERQLAEVDAILGDLLAAARAGLSDLRPKKTALLAWLRARIASEPSPPAIELVTEQDDEQDIHVDLEPALMNRALHNLFANARAHGHPPAEPMEVHVAREGTRVRITVRDAGPGFPPDLLARAFDPFVKGDPARTPGAARDGSGSGLGLALVRRIVEAHGGSAFARNFARADEADQADVRDEPGAAKGNGAEKVRGAEVGMELPLTPS